MGFPKTYESRYKTELHQLLVNYGENKWIWYKISMAPEHNGLRIRTDKDFPGREDMFNNIGNVLSLVHHQGSMSDPDDYQFISNENVTKNHECVAHFGAKCAVCGFVGEQTYGSKGEDLIHVHHLIELSKVGDEYEVNPIKDLIPVCPNCHAMIHR